MLTGYVNSVDKEFACFLSKEDGSSTGDQWYYEIPFRAALEKRMADTAEWLIADPNFETWLQAPESDIFWIKGAPSVGKTVTMAHTIREFIYGDLSLRIFNAYTTYFFFSQSSPDDYRKRYVNLLKSLVFQLWTQTKSNAHMRTIWVLDKLKKDFKASSNESAFWFKLLQRTITSLSGTVYILVDAVDECDDSSLVLSQFRQLSTTCKVKILVSSRLDVIRVEKELKDIRNVLVEPSTTKDDMRRYIIEEFSKTQSVELSDPETDIRDIADLMIEKANGMYTTP